MGGEVFAKDVAATGSDDAGEIARLRREVLKLRQENAKLSGRTQVLKEGVLMRFREQVLSQNWKRRFFDLRVDGSGGSATLRCFECRGGRGGPDGRDTARMTVRLGGNVELLREVPADGTAAGRGGGRAGGEPPFCFQLKLPAGSGPMQLLRLGTDSQEEADAWVEAFEAACLGGGGGAGAAVEAQPSLRRSNTKDVPAGPPKLQKAADTSALRPVHTKMQESVLTAEEDRGGIPDCNVVGIVNLSITVMVIMHIRLIVDNLMKHGLVLDTFRMITGVSSNPGHLRCVVCFLGLSGFAAAALLIEKLASEGNLSELATGSLQGSICILCLAIPIAVIRDTRAAPAVGGTLLVATTVLFLKLVSFVHVNSVLRAQRRSRQQEQQRSEQKGGSREGEEAKIGYPANLNAKSLALFLAYPTLVYQTSYPRSERIRKRWLAKRLGELLVCLALMSVITEQFVVPTLKRSTVPVLSFDVLQIVTAIMKLSVPNVYLWLFMFYALFHVWLNILAELTYFGDRLFYKEWWNATKLEDYWRLWNLPVHNWLVKHVFLPMLNNGFGKPVAVFATFFVSAVFHELLVSVPCHTFRLWAFLGMMAQLPLVNLTAAIDRRLKGSQLGNIIFWISFCIVGQPLCVLLYFAEV